MVASELFFSEYVEGSSLNKALETANFTGNPVDLSEYSVEIYFNGNTTPSTTLNFSGILADGDVFVIADDGADAAILSVADFTPTNSFFNGDDAIALLKNDMIVDVFGQIGVDPGSEWPGGGAEVTLRRLSSITAGDTNPNDPFDASLEWESFPQNTFDGLGSHTIDAVDPTPTEVFVNEIQVSTAGSDWEFFELQGAPGTDLSNLTLLVIESDAGSTTGQIDAIVSLVGQTIPDDGFWLGISPEATAAYGGVTGELVFNTNTFENSTATYLLVEGFTGAVGDDLDGDDDGTLDATPWSAIVDSLTLTDGGADDVAYSDVVIGPDGTFLPSGVFRSPDAPDGSFDNANLLDFSTPDGTPGVANVAPAQPLVINEVLGSTTGNDVEYIELFGEAGTSLDGLSIIVVEGDAGAPVGSIDARVDLGSEDAIGDNGFFLIGNTAILANSVYSVTPNQEIPSNFIENSSYTIALVETSSLTDGTVSGSEVVLDTVGVTDGGASDTFFFDAPVVGPDGPFLPAGVRRVEDGVDTDTVNDWAIGDFFLGSDNTPTAGTGIEPPPPAETTLISAIQGSGEASSRVGDVVTVEAIVVGDFQNADADEGRSLGGFYLQEEDADADGNAATSEGIFVFEGGLIQDVNIGDKVRVTGTVDEFFGETQIDTVTAIEVLSSGNDLPTAATISLPAQSTTLSQDGDVQPDLEAFEGMRVVFEDELTITEMFQLDRFNEIKLSQGDRPEQFTQNNDPSVAGFAAHLQEVGARTITYDDGLNEQNAAIGNLDGFGPVFNTENAPRMGDTITGLAGVLDYKWAGNSASGATWRVRAAEDGTNTFVRENERPATPDPVGGSLKVVSFNVLNYFTTLDAPGVTTANGSDPRGADDLTRFDVFPATAEFERQTEKLVTTILEMDADILGLVELENDFLPGSSGNAIEFLVNTLNEELGAPVYDWVNPGQQFVDTSDAISVGVIYQTDAVRIAPGTSVEVLTDSDLPALGDLGLSDNPIFDGIATNRAPLAVSFEEVATGGVFTVAVNHFKSKGDSGLADDPIDSDLFDDQGNPLFDPLDVDQGDGQGFWNFRRTEAAIALDAWLDTDPTGSNDEDFMIIGDLNAYAQEDPIKFLESQGYVDLAEQFIGDDAYSFVFDGQIGTLDYALANASLVSQVTGTTEWHVNADEADALDYNLDFGRDPDIFDGSVPFRNSDHDPIIVGLDLASAANVIEGTRRNDILTGTDGDDTILGLSGNDTLLGLAGDDILEGDRGNDNLFGGDGSDTLNGGDGHDNLFGDDGDDTISGGDGKDDIVGGDGNDTISGGDGNDDILGGDGNDILSGDDGSDDILGGDGDDILNGGDRNDDLFGEAGNDVLNGDAGNDDLSGGDGDDILVGGDGRDDLTGGAGQDIYVFTSANEGTDEINDFELGQDQIGLTQLFANEGLAGLSFSDAIVTGVISFRERRSEVWVRFDQDGAAGSGRASTLVRVSGDDISEATLSNEANFAL